MGVISFLDWTILATFSGAVGLTVIIVQLLKLPLDKVWKIPTRYVVYVVCAAVMLLAQFFTGNALSAEIIVKTLVNAVLGSLAAMALYEQAIALPEEKRLLSMYQYMMTGQTEDAETTDGEKEVPT